MEDLKKNCIYGTRRRHFPILCRFQILCLVFVATLFAGCTPTLYSVDMKYIPTRTFLTAQGGTPPIALTVAAFQDMRKITDNIVIGRVIKSNGEEIRVLPKFIRPSQAVTDPIKEIFRRAGYQVATESPAWDLQEASINKLWGPILVGGRIDELEVVCRESLTVKKYTAQVKLTIYFADTLKGRIFHTLTTDSSASLEHVLFSEERLEQQINIALSGAIEKMFEGRDIRNMINEGLW
jgi:hypothetical protein